MTAANNRITGSAAAVSNREAVKRLLEEAKKALGGLDDLVNNAGVICTESGPIQ